MNARALVIPILFLVVSFSACSSSSPDEVGQRETARPTRTPQPASSPSVRATDSPPSPAAATDLGPAAHEGDRALEHIRQLSVVIGERVSGTEGETAAVTYIADEFARYGYDVEIMPFTFATGGFVDDSLVVDGEAVPSRRFNGSGTSELEAQAVYVGLADAVGIAGKEADLDGRLALVDRGTLTFSEKWANVAQHGAVGMIVINDREGLFAGRLEPPIDAPVIGVASDAGVALQAAAIAGSTFALQVPDFSAVNVIARPHPDSECTVLVGGHHDTVPLVPGAADNASGTANVIELARAFAADGLDEGLCFVTFGGEESGLHGSVALADRLVAEGELPAAYVNLDVTGTGSVVEIIGDRSLVEDAVAAAGRLGLTANASTEPAGTSSDHASFRARGVPVVFFASDDFSRIHTPADAIDTINADLLDDIGDLAYAVTGELVDRFARG